MRLDELEAPLEAALAILARADLRPLRRFVVVEDQVTGRFVQFGTMCNGVEGADGRVVLDLPTAQLGADGFVEAVCVLGRAYPGDISLQVPDLTPATGVELAVRVLREVHRLPGNAELRLEEGATNAPRR